MGKCKLRTKLYLEFPPNNLLNNYFLIQILIRNLYSTSLPNRRYFEAVSTFKPGVGGDRQTKIFTIYHLSCNWREADTLKYMIFSISF